jgi:signal peptidase II
MRKNSIFWIVAIIGIVLDRLTKYAVLQNFIKVGDTIPIWNQVFHFTYTTNTGAAFSSFTNGVSWLRWLSLAFSLGLMAFGIFGPRLKLLEQLSCGFILAGAFGNGIDRFLFGYVIDFLDFRLINFPIFNLADTFINIGMFLFLLTNLYPGWLTKNSSQSNSDRSN